MTEKAVENYVNRSQLKVVGYEKARRGKVSLFDRAEVENFKRQREQVAYSVTPAKSQALTLTDVVKSNDVRAFLVEAIREAINAPTIEQLQSKTLLAVDEASKVTGLTAYTLRRMLQSGEIKGEKIGGAWRITPEALRRRFEKPKKS